MRFPLDIERASYASWPAFEQVDDGGWILRCADGCTKRANSINVTAPTAGVSLEAVARCESFYRLRKQPTIFRLLSFVDDPELDSHLAGAGYALIDFSLVMCRPLDRPFMSTEPLPNLDRKEWLKVYHEVSGTHPSRNDAHLGILERIPASSLFTVLEDEGRPVACGLGVLHESHLGLFDIVTRQQNRRQGHGARLVTGLLDWGQREGGTNAYVQVMANNPAAIRLYEKLGYRRLYHYWYRMERTS